MKKEVNEQFSPNANLWLSVKKDIEARIITGEYAAGSKIPTIVELVAQYKIGKTTAQKIINALYDEEIIFKRVGIGCFVRPYVREKLAERHKAELELHINSAVEEAFLLGFDREYVRMLVDEVWKSFSKKESPSA